MQYLTESHIPEDVVVVHSLPRCSSEAHTHHHTSAERCVYVQFESNVCIVLQENDTKDNKILKE